MQRPSACLRPNLRSSAEILRRPESVHFLFHLIHSLDVSVYQFLNGFAGNWLIDRLVGYEEGNNLFKGGVFLAKYAYIWFRAGPRQEERRREIVAILTGTLFALALARTIANIAPYRL